MKLVVYHTLYGCDTGCCGHVVSVDDEEDFETFTFNHPSRPEEYRTFAENLIRRIYGDDHVKDLDWDACLILDD